MERASRPATFRQIRRWFRPEVIAGGLLLAGAVGLPAQDAELWHRPWPADSPDLAARLELGPSGFTRSLADPGDAAERYRHLFADRSMALFERLAESPDRSLALQASWEMVVFPGVPPATGVSQAKVYPPDPWDGLARHARVLREKLGVEPPYWWLRCLAGRLLPTTWAGEADLLRQVHQDWIKDALFARRFHSQGGPQPRLSQRKGRVQVGFEAGARSFEVELTGFDSPWRLDDRRDLQLPHVADEAGHYLGVILDDPAMSSCLVAVDQDGKLRWISPVWATGHIGLGWESAGFATLVVGPEGPVVFGSYASGEFAELFDVATGQAKARFHNRYWTIADYVRSRKGEVPNTSVLKPPVRLVQLAVRGEAGVQGVLRDIAGREFSFQLCRRAGADQPRYSSGHPAGEPLEEDLRDLWEPFGPYPATHVDLGTRLTAALKAQFRPDRRGRLVPLHPADFAEAPREALTEAATRLGAMLKKPNARER